MEFLLNTETLTGPVNLAAPEPVTNAHMMKTFRQLLHMPIGLPAPRPMLEIGAWAMRTESELVLKSRRVVSRKLPEAGFRLQFAQFREALADLLQSPSTLRGSAVAHA